VTFLLIALLSACELKGDDTTDTTPHTDGGTPDGGTPDGGGTSDGGSEPCRYDWRGAPCSSEWEGKHNCDECGKAYTCEAGSATYPLTWVHATIPCECVDLATGEILREVKGCEDVGG